VTPELHKPDKIMPKRRTVKTKMKRKINSIAVLALCAVLLFTGACGHARTINGVKYQPYGLVDKDDLYSPNVKYHVVAASVVCAIVFSETFLIPGWVVGWNLWEPVGPAGTEKK
jgi:hypothetical protein